MYTLVLSGPINGRAQVGTALRQSGIEVERGNEDAHGFPIQDGESWISAHGHPDQIGGIDVFGWTLRLHWEHTGDWRRVGALDVPDPVAEVNRLRSELRAVGISV